MNRWVQGPVRQRQFGELDLRALRKRLRATRNLLTPQQVRNASHAITIKVVTQPFFRNARRLAFYVPNDNEVDVSALMQTALQFDKTCYLPVVTDRLRSWQRSPLLFQPFDPRVDAIAFNRFRIAEPVYDPRRVLRTEMLDVIFAPLVGFHRSGARLGMGMGFYDRTLAPLTRRFRRPRLVGLAYALQEVDELAMRQWDVPMDAIVTEKEVIRVD